jgi:hypothetical protein
VNLAPADDLIIRVEYPLGIDPHAQLLASVMSKKKAVGAEFLAIDIPVGAGTKVPTMEKAQAYAKDFVELGERLGMHVECAITYGEQPVGRAIGPALEASEAISILEGNLHPSSVIEKACGMAGMLLEMGGIKRGEAKAREILMSGKALEKFREIVAAQGGDPNLKSEDIRVGQYTYDITAKMCGYVNGVRNKELVALARAAGAPKDKGAGVLLHKKRGNRVDDGEAVLTIYADSPAKLEQAIELSRKFNPVTIEGMSCVTLTDCDLTGAGQNGVLLYRSGPSGATNGMAALHLTNCKLTTTSDGPFFSVTNTEAKATLSGSTLTYPSGVLAQVSGNVIGNWGVPGQNGGAFTLTGVGQVLSGDVTVDTISVFSLILTRGSIYAGSIDGSNVGKSVSVTLDADSSWTLTADSHVDTLADAMPGLNNIQSDGFMLYYDAQNSANAWLNGATVSLPGGGMLTPMT